MRRSIILFIVIIVLSSCVLRSHMNLIDNLSYALDSVKLDSDEYENIFLNVSYPDYLCIKKRTYFIHIFDTIRTCYVIDEDKQSIDSGPFTEALNENQINYLCENDYRLRQLLLDLLKFRRLAQIGTITQLRGRIRSSKCDYDSQDDLTLFFWYKGRCYQLTHITKEAIRTTDTIINKEWHLSEVEPIEW